MVSISLYKQDTCISLLASCDWAVDMQGLGVHTLQTQPAPQCDQVQVSMMACSPVGATVLTALLCAQKSWGSSSDLSLDVPSHMAGSFHEENSKAWCSLTT